jgi:hypothetical protein
MRVKFLSFSFLMMFMMGLSSAANAADMDTGYLVGNWAIGTAEQKCADAESERFVFDKNGTFETSRSNKAEAVGFWRIDGDTVRLDFISSGGFFQDIHAQLKALENRFSYFKVKLVPFNVEENRFEAVGILGDQVNKGVAVRCK